MRRSNPVLAELVALDCRVASLLAMTVEGAADRIDLGGPVKEPCVYMMTNRRNGTIYTGVTGRPLERFYEHREGLVPGFSKQYGCKSLVWYEVHETMLSAITREKQIKAGSRADKLALIENLNPEWIDLYDTLF